SCIAHQHDEGPDRRRRRAGALLVGRRAGLRPCGRGGCPPKGRFRPGRVVRDDVGHGARRLGGSPGTGVPMRARGVTAMRVTGSGASSPPPERGASSVEYALIVFAVAATIVV